MENIPDYSTTPSEFQYRKHIIHGTLRKSFSAVKYNHYTHKKKDYKDTFFKTHFKALKMTTPITVFLK